MNMFNWLSIFAGTLAWVMVESLLYNPVHAWGRFWAKESGMAEKMEKQKMSVSDMLFTFGGTLLVGVFMAIGLSHAVKTASAGIGSTFGVSPLVAALMMAFLNWLAFYGVGQFVLAAYSGQSKKLIGLHLLNGLIGLLVLGLVIGLLG